MKIFEFFKEANGQYSCMRLISFILVSIVMITWMIISVKTGVLIGFDWQELFLVVTPFMGKTVSKFGEGKIDA